MKWVVSAFKTFILSLISYKNKLNQKHGYCFREGPYPERKLFQYTRSREIPHVTTPGNSYNPLYLRQPFYEKGI